MDPYAGLMRGRCPACGWQTENVESRRFEELQGLTRAHGQAGMRALDEVIRAGVVSYAEFVGILNEASATTGHPRVVGTIEGGAAEAAPTLYWGEPLTESDANWPAQGSTCAHICGADPNHTCEAEGSMRLAYDLPSGGRRLMPICGPCHASETAAREAADAC